MAPVFEHIREPSFGERVAPLETAIPEFREQTGRHMASRVFMDGFSPLEQPESLFEPLRTKLNSKIIEQPEAIDAIVSAMDRLHVRSDRDKGPAAVLAFLGPTGVGKSETAKLLSELIGEGESNLIKIDCTNYGSGHEVSGLTGAPPSYVGREQVPLFSKKNIEQPNTILLIDEAEKAHDQFHNILLQVFEDGEIRLNNGEVTSFSDVIIILTSNLGAKELGALMNSNTMGFGEHKAETDKKVLNKTAVRAFKDFFRPEFTNRIDELVVFHPLSTEGMGKVLNVKLDEINDQYEQDHGMRISLTDATVEHLVGIAEKEPQFGARPMVRAFKKSILTPFGRYTGSDEVGEGTHIRVFHRDEFPEGYQHTDDRELIFASKADSSIKRKPTPTSILPYQKPQEAETPDDSTERVPDEDPSLNPEAA